MKLDISEQCFVDYNHHQQHHYDSYQDENYYEAHDDSPFYTQIIRTQPVQSSTSQNARLLRNDQCAMTNEETRRLTGLVAKTRALFESSFAASNNGMTKPRDSDLPMVTPNRGGVSTARIVLPNSQSIYSAINKNGSSSNSNRNFCKMKQSYSANNVNGLPKCDHDERDIYDETYNEKENRTTNKTYIHASNSSQLISNYNKFNLGSANILSNNDTDSSAFSRPPFVRVKRFQSPSLSQSQQMFDSLANRKVDSFSNQNENEVSRTSTKNLHSSNRLVALSNFKNTNTNNTTNDNGYPRVNG